MNSVNFKYWQDGSYWVGYLEEYPDYWTQEESMVELKENLLDLQDDFTKGNVPNVIRRGELKIS